MRFTIPASCIYFWDALVSENVHKSRKKKTRQNSCVNMIWFNSSGQMQLDSRRLFFSAFCFYIGPLFYNIDYQKIWLDCECYINCTSHGRQFELYFTFQFKKRQILVLNKKKRYSTLSCQKNLVLLLWAAIHLMVLVRFQYKI